MRKLLQLQVDVQICAHTCECIRMYGARMQYAYHLFPDSHSMVFAADAKCGYVSIFSISLTQGLLYLARGGQVLHTSTCTYRYACVSVCVCETRMVVSSKATPSNHNHYCDCERRELWVGNSLRGGMPRLDQLG